MTVPDRREVDIVFWLGAVFAAIGCALSLRGGDWRIAPVLYLGGLFVATIFHRIAIANLNLLAAQIRRVDTETARIASEAEVAAAMVVIMMRISSTVPRTQAKTPIGILKAAVKFIRAEPLRYDQGDWINDTNIDGKAPPCGTVVCVAGAVVVLTRPPTQHDSQINMWTVHIIETAQRKLKLTNREADELFDGNAVRGRPGTKRYAERGVRHIERFMRARMGYKGKRL